MADKLEHNIPPCTDRSPALLAGAERSLWIISSVGAMLTWFPVPQWLGDHSGCSAAHLSPAAFPPHAKPQVLPWDFSLQGISHWKVWVTLTNFLDTPWALVAIEPKPGEFISLISEPRAKGSATLAQSSQILQNWAGQKIQPWGHSASPEQHK